jgi:NAD-dependent dihydropyrimidine dehydrogenase PreA subunit
MWVINKNKCMGCGACVGVCPKIAIELLSSGINHNEKFCILCGICKKLCPVGAIEVDKT